MNLMLQKSKKLLAIIANGKGANDCLSSLSGIDYLGFPFFYF